MKFVVVFIISFSPFFSKLVFAAACCAGSTVMPSLMSGDEKAVFSVSSSYSKVVGDAPVKGRAIFREPKAQDEVFNYRLDSSYLIEDRFQIGATVPLVQRLGSEKYKSNKGFGLGDIRTNIGYEFLPEYYYSPYKPKGFVFLFANFPTGESIYEISQGLTSTGRGFYTLGIGTLLLKQWSLLDMYLLSEVHQGFRRTFENPESVQTIYPNRGASVALGTGINTTVQNMSLRIGARVQPTYSQKKKIIQAQDTRYSAAEMVWDCSLESSLLITDENSVSIVYNDQTLMGPAENTTLTRSIALQYQRKWLR